MRFAGAGPADRVGGFAPAIVAAGKPFDSLDERRTGSHCAHGSGRRWICVGESGAGGDPLAVHDLVWTPGRRGTSDAALVAFGGVVPTLVAGLDSRRRQGTAAGKTRPREKELASIGAGPTRLSVGRVRRNGLGGDGFGVPGRFGVQAMCHPTWLTGG